MENRKAQIIELTLRNIREKGYLSFSYDDLAKELGVTKASIHYHFMKKEDLGLAVCKKIKEGLEKTYVYVNQLQINNEDKLWEFISRRTKQIGDNEVCPLSSLQADFNFIPESMQESVRQLSEMEIKCIESLIEGIKKEGDYKGIQDTEALAALMITSVKGALQYRRVLGSELYSFVFRQLKQLFHVNNKL